MAMQYYYEKVRYNLQEPQRYFSSTSPRKLLFSMNFIIAVLGLGLSAFSIFLSVLLYDPKFISGWVIWLGLSFGGIFLATTCIIGMRGAHLVSLELLLTYFWLIMVCLAPFLLGTVAAFDFNFYLEIWFKHQWNQTNFTRVRKLFCHPKDTYNNRCLALPMNLQQYNNQTQYCESKYGHNDCVEVHENAINNAIRYGKTLTLTQGGVCIFIIFLIAWSIYTCHKIVTSLVITQSMNDIINYLLLISICGCTGMTYYLWWIKEYRIQYSWIAEFFMALAIAQVTAIPLGVYAGRLKSRTLLTIYQVLVFSITTGLALTGALGLFIAGIIPQSFTPTTSQASDIACIKGLSGCCCCDLPSGKSFNRCPEWSKSDTIKMVVADLQIAGAIAFISMLYVIGALIVASIVRHNLKNYKTDYI